jgi:hypothetical protein
MTDVIVKLISSSNYRNIALLKDNGDVLIGLKDNIGQPQAFVLRYSSNEKNNSSNNEKNKITDIAW